MRYRLDADGYVELVLWGCLSGDCLEYTGTVPSGYTSLPEWAENAIINAYYIENGNLVLDSLRKSNLELLHEQQAIDYAPVLHKDLFETNEIIDAQYIKTTVSGVLNVIEDARSLSPMVKVQGLTADKITIFAQTKNMLPINFVSETKGGLTFAKDGENLTITGTATEDVEYTIAGGGTDPIFAILTGYTYTLALGSCTCEMLYYDGETTQQVYAGTGGSLSLSENKAVTQVKLKISSGAVMNETFRPALSFSGTSAADEAKVKAYTIDLTGKTLESGAYVLIGGGLAALYSGGVTTMLRSDNMRLLNGYNMVYTDHKNTLDITYTSNVLQVDDMAFLQGKATTTGKFMILEDGSIIATNGEFSGDITCSNLTVENGATVSGLVVGDNVTMGSNAVLSWSNLPSNVASEGQIPTSTSDLTNDSGYCTETRATTITNTAISTAEISADQITTGTLNAENVQIIGNIYRAKGSWADSNFLIGVNSGYSRLQIGSASTSPGYSSASMYTNGIFYLITSGTSTSNYAMMVDAAGCVSANNFRVETSSTVTNTNVGYFTSNGGAILQKYASSSRKYKHDITPLSEELKAAIRGLYDVPVMSWTYNLDHLNPEDELYGKMTYGIIAEDLEEVLPEAVIHEDGEVENYRDRQLLNAMLMLLQEQKEKIDELEARIEKLEGLK